MTRRQWAFLGLGGAVVLVAGLAIGFALSSRSSTSSPSPSAAFSSSGDCQVSVSPDVIRVDPNTGDSSDVLAVAGTGFPASSAVSIFLPVTVMDVTTTAQGGFSMEIEAEAGVTHAAPPDTVGGVTIWNVTGWDAPEPPDEFGSVPPRACQTQVAVTVELTAAVSPTPPTDLVAGGYAEVLADGVRVRVEPSLEATAVGALFTGDVVRILEPAQVAEGVTWYRVESVVTQSGESVRGYMAAGFDGQVYLRPTAEPPPPTPTPEPTPTPGASSS
jgi:hypothetical protein